MSKSILYAKSAYELIKILSNNPGTQVVGGCTQIEDIPEKFISTHGIKELAHIVRHERYLDVGPGATLSELMAVGQNHLPPIIYEALSNIATPFVRNIATIGGNICAENHKHTLFAPLMALDARLEFKNQSETRPENIRNFKGVPEGFILSNLRIPLLDAELSIFRRIGSERTITQQSASFAFLADTEKYSLLKVHLAFAGPFTFHSQELENSLIGKRLPLSQKDIIQIENQFENEFTKAATDKMMSVVTRQQFSNLVRYSFEQLT